MAVGTCGRWWRWWKWWGIFILWIHVSRFYAHDTEIDDTIDLKDDEDNTEGLFSNVMEAVSAQDESRIPSMEGLSYVEMFQDDGVFSRWIRSQVPKFSGRWEIVKHEVEVFNGDKGLRVMDSLKHHAIATQIMPEKLAFINNKGKHIVLSYEVKFEKGLQCGGAYMKLFNTKDLKYPKLESFDNETPYTIMFGPDFCGATNKIHLIIKHPNPITNEWEEHRLIDYPLVPHGRTTHVYGFHLAPDNTYQVFIDGNIVKQGSMKTDFDPPFTPPEEIDDPNDKKPDDWEDLPQIFDPKAQKPDDWDEDAPLTIPDPKAKKPENWLDLEPKEIPDPNAKRPETWNDSVDGEWKPPVISNPVCATASGCGPWTPPIIANPAYKGKWAPPLISNPAYKGPWKSRKIPNKNHFVNEDPHAIADVNAIGFELWTLQDGILFDNIVTSRDMEPVNRFVSETWKIRHSLELTKPGSTKKKVETPKEIPKGTLLLDNLNSIIDAMKNIVIVRSSVIYYSIGLICVTFFFLAMLLKKLFKSKSASSQTNNIKNKNLMHESSETLVTDTSSSDREDRHHTPEEGLPYEKILTRKGSNAAVRKRKTQADD